MQSPFLDPWLGCIGRATHQHVQEGKESHQGPDSSNCLRWLGWPAATWPRGFSAALFLGLCRCLCFKCFRVCSHTFAALWNEFVRYFYNDVGSSSNWPPTSDTKSLYANWTSHCQRRPVHIHCDFSDRYRILPSKFLAQAWKGKDYIFIGGCHEVLALQITNIFLSGVLLQVSL